MRTGAPTAKSSDFVRLSGGKGGRCGYRTVLHVATDDASLLKVAPHTRSTFVYLVYNCGGELQVYSYVVFLCTGYPYPVPYYTVYNLNRVHNFVELGEGGVGADAQERRRS